MTEKQQTTEIKRAPIIAVMGHIDHGKSTLLDYIRHTNIVDKEAGGITQTTSAYEVVHKTSEGKEMKITFLDTPGHEAFQAMRARGAKVADIAILVVSAEEGVKAQTLEALRAIQEAGTPFVVAINKIDKPNANPDQTKQSLAENEVFVEGWGGQIPCVNISAKSGQGIPELLDMLLLVADLEDLKANPKLPASGFVIESNLDPRAGITATLIIKEGTLSASDFLVVGKSVSKIKKLENFMGEMQKTLGPSSPAKVFGFTELPAVGYSFQAFADKKEAEKAAQSPSGETESSKPASANADLNSSEAVEIPVVLKSDVAGTLEALEVEINKLVVEKVRLNVVAKNVGPINEGDIKLVSAFPNALIIGFRVKVEKSAQALAEKTGINIQTSDIIYKLSEWLEEVMKERAPKTKVEEMLGRAKILKVFSRSKDKQIIGGTVTVGKFVKGKEVRIIRREAEVGRGKVLDLQIQKLKTAEVEEGNQFGSEVESKIEVAPGDYLEAFDVVVK